MDRELHDSIVTIRNQLKESNTKADELIFELENILGHADKQSIPTGNLEQVIDQLKQEKSVSAEVLNDIRTSLDNLVEPQEDQSKTETKESPKIETEKLQQTELQRTGSQSSNSPSLLETPNTSPRKLVERNFSAQHSDLLQNDIDTDSVNWDTSFYYSKQRPLSPGASSMGSDTQSLTISRNNSIKKPSIISIEVSTPERSQSDRRKSYQDMIESEVASRQERRESRSRTVDVPLKKLSSETLIGFLVESKQNAVQLREKLQNDDPDAKVVIEDLQKIEQFYDEQIKRAHVLQRVNSYSDRMKKYEDKINVQHDEIKRLKDDIEMLNHHMRTFALRNQHSKSGSHGHIGERLRTLSENITKSQSSLLDGDDLDLDSYIDYNSAVSHIGSPQSPRSPQLDQDANKVETHLDMIEKNRESHTNLPLKLSPSTITLTENGNDSLPKLDTIEDDSLLQNVAALKIQCRYRGYKARRLYKKVIIRKHVIKELFDTEVNYVKGLLGIYKQYVIPLRFKSVSGEPILKKDAIEIIFFHIKEIMTFNHTLLGKIEKRIQKWSNETKIGDIFVENSEGLEIYTHYINNYEKALILYEDNYQHNPTFRKFLSSIKSKQEKCSLSLLDLLITPIQRIPRYVLLLKELLKNTKKDHGDYCNILLAISKLQQVAETINERKRQSENIQRLLKIQERISDCPILTDSSERKLQMEGDIIEMLETGKRKQRHLFLFNDLLVCTQLHKQRFGSSSSVEYDFKWLIKLSENQVGQIERSSKSISSDEEQSKHYAIGIKGKEKHILLAPSLEDLDKWLQSIGDARLQQAQQRSRSNAKNKSYSSLAKRYSLRQTTLSPRELPTFDLNSVIDIHLARKTVREKLEQYDAEVRAEARVLFDLQRLSSNKSPKIIDDVSKQKEETTKILQSLQNESEKLTEFFVFLEKYRPVSKNREYLVIYLDYTDFNSILNNQDSQQLKMFELQLDKY